jgi:uncharacterized protein YndB with AHSA1/START domain
MHVAAEITIDASPTAVFAIITQPQLHPEWQEAAIWTKVRTPGPLAVGSQMDHEGRFMGMRVRTSGQVTDCEPGRLLAYEFTSRFGATTMRYSLLDAVGSTRLRLSADAPLPWFMRPFARFLARDVQGMFERDVVRLRSVVESGRFSGPS